MISEEVQESRRWLDHANADYVAAAQCSDPYSICFHAQQWIEKTAKAVLALHGAKIPHNHKMAPLLASCEQLEPSLAGISRHAALLQPYAVSVRYEDRVKAEAADQCAAVWSAAMEISAAVQTAVRRSEPDNKPMQADGPFGRR